MADTSTSQPLMPAEGRPRYNVSETFEKLRNRPWARYVAIGFLAVFIIVVLTAFGLRIHSMRKIHEPIPPAVATLTGEQSAFVGEN